MVEENTNLSRMVFKEVVFREYLDICQRSGWDANKINCSPSSVYCRISNPLNFSIGAPENCEQSLKTLIGEQDESSRASFHPDELSVFSAGKKERYLARHLYKGFEKATSAIMNASGLPLFELRYIIGKGNGNGTAERSLVSFSRQGAQVTSTKLVILREHAPFFGLENSRCDYKDIKCAFALT